MRRRCASKRRGSPMPLSTTFGARWRGRSSSLSSPSSASTGSSATSFLLHSLSNWPLDRKSTRLNSSHSQISYAVFCLKKKRQPDSISPNRTIHTPIKRLDESNPSSHNGAYRVGTILHTTHRHTHEP